MALFNTVWSHGVSHQASSTILSPQNGTRVSNPFLVKFGIKNFMVAPAGKNIHKAGHFHLLIDLDSELSMDDPIPYNQHHRHFDNGETEVLISLSPGKHTLQLVVGDEEHEPFEQLVSEKITIEVIE
jgi:hypothetical protein